MRKLLPIFIWLIHTSSASAFSSNDQLRDFANCAGRLTAQLEHAWLMNDDSAPIIEHQRAQVVDLLTAVLPPDRGREVLNWRVDARAAQRGLLEQATFGQDENNAAWARRLATQYVADCTSFLLS